MIRVKTYQLFFSVIFLLCTAAAVQAQVKFSVIPSKAVVRQNETFQVQFVVEGTTEVEEFNPPAFRNFEQLSGLDQSTGWTWVNGSLSEYVSYTILLRAKLKGKLPIASAVIKAKGKMLTSAPLMIFVTDATAAAAEKPSAPLEEEKPDYYLQPGENVKDKIAKNLFIRATVDKHTCYVGQPILATFKLFTRLDSESKILKRPSLNGFSVIDLEQPEAGFFSKEMVNGKLFNCYLIRKVQLFPLQSGMLSIEPVEVENMVRMIRIKAGSSRETGNWLDAMMEKMKDAEVNSDDIIREKLVLKSDGLKINVLELPEKNKPETFNGAVGTYTMEAGLLKNEIAANDNATLRIIIKGSGNIPMITAPSVNWPSGVDSFEAKLSEDIDKTTSPISGTKTFDIPFSVSKAGKIEIPAVRFSYFNEKTKSYETITTQPLQLNVTAAAKRKAIVTVGSPDKVKKGTANVVWLAGGGGLLLLAGSIFFFVSRKKKPDETITPTEESELKSRKTVAEFLQPAVYVQDGLHHKQFYTLLLDGLQQFFIDRFNLQVNTNGNKQIIELLKQKQCDDLAAQFQQITADCEMVVFSAVNMNDSKDQLLQQTIQLMTEAEKRI